MKYHIDVSTALLLSLCRKGARITVDNAQYECIRGVSPQAEIIRATVHPTVSTIIRIEYTDPHGEEMVYPEWRNTSLADAYHQPDRTMEGRG